MPDVYVIDLTLGDAAPMPLNLGADLIALSLTNPVVPLTAEVRPIALIAQVDEINLQLSGTVQGPPGQDGAGAETFGSYLAGENLSSSSLIHISTNDGKAYLADFELDRPATGFTISGFNIGATLSLYRSGLLYGLSGIVSGKSYWLGNSGQVRDTIPDHGVTQRCGDGASATEVIVSISEDIDWE